MTDPSVEEGASRPAHARAADEDGPSSVRKTAPRQEPDVDNGPASGPPIVPSTRGGAVDPRMLAAWREWLTALATDAEAAIAAAHVYDALAADGRDAWLDALLEDAPNLAVPRLALYAPLLSVETDPDRRARMEVELFDEILQSSAIRLARAVRGVAEDGARVIALVRGLYLSFVQVLWCRYSPDEGFAWVRHDPLLRESDAPKDGVVVDGTTVEATPIKPVIEELAHAILAERRRGGELSSALGAFADLFDAKFDGEPFV